MGLSDCVCCARPADDEYHWYETVRAYGEVAEVRVVWKLCGECCEFAVDVVESVSNLEEEVERWKTESPR